MSSSRPRDDVVVLVRVTSHVRGRGLGADHRPSRRVLVQAYRADGHGVVVRQEKLGHLVVAVPLAYTRGLCRNGRRGDGRTLLSGSVMPRPRVSRGPGRAVQGLRRNTGGLGQDSALRREEMTSGRSWPYRLLAEKQTALTLSSWYAGDVPGALVVVDPSG